METEVALMKLMPGRYGYDKKRNDINKIIMRRHYFLLVVAVLLSFVCRANNIRVDSVRYKATDVTSGSPRLTMSFTVVWENSWRDDYNYDAAYVFFKFKRKEKDTKSPEEWHHLYLAATGNKIKDGFGNDYDFWLCPLSAEGTNYNPGVYIYRKQKGVYPLDSVQMEVTWDVTKQLLSPQLTTEDIRNGNVQIVAHAIEMVYIPRGVYRIGDGVSDKGFRKLAFPILPEYDIVSKSYDLESSNDDSTAMYAADRINDNTNNATSEWKGNGKTPYWWSIDYGAGNPKRITYFGVNASKSAPNNIPTTFRLLATVDPDAENVTWVELWSGSGKEYWIVAKDAYPIEKAIKIAPDKVGSYRAYKITIDGMSAGVPVVSSIGMTEKDLESLNDYSVLIDSPVTVKDSLRQLGAADGSVWTAGTIPATFPNGYPAFYAMKYEVSQDQYVRFLNKLTYNQQNGLLNGRLAQLKEGDYIFGDPGKANCRNGIVVATKIEGLPVVFACDLYADDPSGQERDGQNVACNYMSVNDMLAYADWACLRPLSEMEYEKMSRPFYPNMPVPGSYAWGTTKLERPDPSQITGMGTPLELAKTGNANFGGTLKYPLRVGAFARSQKPGIEECGAGFWGCMDLCGNLAEMYYNVNKVGLTLILPEKVTGAVDALNGHNTAHGNGYLAANGLYNGAISKQWSEAPAAIAVRGGSFATDAARLTVSDRTWYTGFYQTAADRDSTVTFRLGRTAPTFDELQSWLITENQATTQGQNRSDFFLNATTYMIRGNKPENPQGGLMNYIWYYQESGGEWKVLEGQANQNLYFDKYKTDTIASNVNGLNFRFKRKAFSPFSDSESSSVYTVDLIANPFTNAVETFKHTGDTYTVTNNWEASIPRVWGVEGVATGLAMNSATGTISGLNATLGSITATLTCPLYENIVYKKKVREVRDFNYTGAVQTLKLNPGTYKLECWGAEGGGRRLSGNANSGLGGKGGYSVGTLVLTSAQTLYIYVGGYGASSNSGNAAGGFNGGGQGCAYNSVEPGNGGGGASDIRIGTNTLYYRVIVAGGGGGGGEDGGDPYGHGGGTTGVGYNTSYDASQSAPGSGGSFGQGGGTNKGDGGGGGGGWYGGGTSSTASGGGDTQGGGGGSGYVWTAATAKYAPTTFGLSATFYLQNAQTIAGNQTMPKPNTPLGQEGTTMVGNLGHGHVRITAQ